MVAPSLAALASCCRKACSSLDLDAESNVALGVGRQVAKGERGALVDAALSAMRIQHLRKRAVPTLSGGEQQRVALARALAQQPRVMLLDEPFHSVDGAVRRDVIHDLQGVAREKGTAMLLVTHDTIEAAAFAERVILMRDGKVVQMGTMGTLRDQPADPWGGWLSGKGEPRPMRDPAHPSRFHHQLVERQRVHAFGADGWLGTDGRRGSGPGSPSGDQHGSGDAAGQTSTPGAQDEQWRSPRNRGCSVMLVFAIRPWPASPVGAGCTITRMTSTGSLPLVLRQGKFWRHPVRPGRRNFH